MASENGNHLVVGFCLDESGSMGTIHQATIDGFNEYVNDLRGQDGKTTLSLTMFSDAMAGEPLYREFCNAADITTLAPLTTSSYRPRGGTPLFDAIGHTIKQLESWLSAQTDTPTVLFVIQTDGCENASREFKRQDVIDLIRRKETEGWRFVYLGADQDAYEAEQAAVMMGMSANASFSYDSVTTGATYRAAAKAASVARADSTLSSAQVTQTLRDEHGRQQTQQPTKPVGKGRRAATRRRTDPNF